MTALPTPAMKEAAARAAEPETFALPRINLNKPAYDRAYARATAALTAAMPLMLEKSAKVADGLRGEGPSAPYDNGSTSDGWNLACDHIAEAIRNLTPKAPSNV